MDNNLYAQMEQYLASELLGDELERFKQALQQDPELVKAMREYQEADADFKLMMQEDETEAALARQMKQLGSEYCVEQKAAPAPVRRMRRWWTLAAAAAAVLIFFIAKPLFFRNPSLQELYSSNHEPYTLDTATGTRGTKSATDSLLQQADDLFRLKRYAEAIPKYREYFQVTGNLSLTGFPLATAYFETGSPDSANFYYNQVADKIPALRNQAIWYQAMIKLKEKDKEGCRVLLQKINPENDSKYAKRAVALLRKL
jgi:tetratricopeptide (TPR) repeat protein